MFDIRQWLEEQGLGEYVQNFVANHVDEQTLPELTADDLKELGVNSIGHRRRLLNAASKLAHPENNGDAAKQPAADAGANVVATQAAERRNLTILFVDLVGSTELPVNSIRRTFAHCCRVTRMQSLRQSFVIKLRRKHCRRRHCRIFRLAEGI